VSPGPEAQPAIRSTFAGLTVLVPPEAPKITQGDVIYATEDRKVEIECVSVGGKPAAEVSVLSVFLKKFRVLKIPVKVSKSMQ